MTYYELDVLTPLYFVRVPAAGPTPTQEDIVDALLAGRPDAFTPRAFAAQHPELVALEQIVWLMEWGAPTVMKGLLGTLDAIHRPGEPSVFLRAVDLLRIADARGVVPDAQRKLLPDEALGPIEAVPVLHTPKLVTMDAIAE